MKRSAQSADASAFKALKLASKPNQSGMERERTQKASEKATLEIGDGPVRAAFTKTLEHLSQQNRLAEIGQPSEAPVDSILLLGRFGMVRTAEFAATRVTAALREKPSEELLAAAPSARFIESLAKKKHDLTAMILEMIAREPGNADSSATVDWLVKRAKPAELAKVAGLLASSRERLPHLAPYATLLPMALLRDKGNVILQALLSASRDDLSVKHHIGSALTSDPRLTRHFLKSIPKLVAAGHQDFVFNVLESWLPRYAGTALRAREALGSSLAVLVIALLKKPKRNEEHNGLLDLISRSLADCIPKIKESGDAEHFWIFARAADLVQSLSASMHVSYFGAGLVASAIEKASTGGSADAVLEALALNLGLIQVGTPGEKVAFNPEIHEDVLGGLLPNDPVVVRTTGWSLDGKLIRRANVTDK
jgi:hypothetical protein